jgi:hypothetical protein
MNNTNTNNNSNNQTSKGGASISLRIGWEVDNVLDLAALLKDAQTLNFDFIIVPLVHPLYRRHVSVSSQARDSVSSSLPLSHTTVGSEGIRCSDITRYLTKQLSLPETMSLSSSQTLRFSRLID